MQVSPYRQLLFVGLSRERNRFYTSSAYPMRVPDATIIAGSTHRSFEDAGPDFFHFFTLQIGRRRKSQLCHFSGAKVFRVTERFQTELRGSFFNVGNFANFDIPGHAPGNADFGIISSARPARTV